MELTDGDIKIRDLQAGDYPFLLKWLTNEKVLAYYGGRDIHYTMDSLKAHYEKDFDDGFRVIFEFQNIPVGYGQVYRVNGEMFGEYCYPVTDKIVYAMDQFIGKPDYWNRGIGSRFVNTMCLFLRDTQNASVVILDPRQDNPRAIRAYQKAGFQIICPLPEHEMFEGKKVDCWLMERKLTRE